MSVRGVHDAVAPHRLHQGMPVDIWHFWKREATATCMAVSPDQPFVHDMGSIMIMMGSAIILLQMHSNCF